MDSTLQSAKQFLDAKEIRSTTCHGRCSHEGCRDAVFAFQFRGIWYLAGTDDLCDITRYITLDGDTNDLTKEQKIEMYVVTLHQDEERIIKVESKFWNPKQQWIWRFESSPGVYQYRKIGNTNNPRNKKVTVDLDTGKEVVYD